MVIALSDLTHTKVRPMPDLGQDPEVRPMSDLTHTKVRPMSYLGQDPEVRPMSYLGHTVTDALPMFYDLFATRKGQAKGHTFPLPKPDLSPTFGLGKV
jgi:hypothetical protein